MNPLAALLLCVTMEPPVIDRPVGDITGQYTVSGSDGNGKTYSGAALIDKRGDAYAVTWVQTLSPAVHGIGVRMNDVLSVGWLIDGKSGPGFGVTHYTVRSGGRLVGRWAGLPGDGQIRSETLTLVAPLEDEP